VPSKAEYQGDGGSCSEAEEGRSNTHRGEKEKKGGEKGRGSTEREGKKKNAGRKSSQKESKNNRAVVVRSGP